MPTSKNTFKTHQEYLDWYNNYYHKNKERISLKLAEWRKKNKDKIAQYNRSSYSKNLIKSRERIAKYRKEHPAYFQVAWHKRAQRSKNAEGSFTKDEWDNLKKVFNYTCFMCLKKEPEIKLTIDHKIPLSKGGSNYIDNIQPLCKPCNSRKFNKILFASIPL